MKTMAALAAPPSRTAAPPGDAGNADGGSDGNFAAVLGQARDPVKAAVDRSAKSPTRAAPSAQHKDPAKPTAAREPVREASAAPAQASGAGAADSAGTPLPAPGWPEAPSAPEALGTDLMPAVAVALADDAATRELDSTLRLDEGAPLANAITPGRPDATSAAAAIAAPSAAAAAVRLDGGAPLANAITPGRPRAAKAALPALVPADLSPGKPDATAAAAASAAPSTAAAAVALTVSAARPATDAVAMSAPTLSALPAHVASATPATPGAATAATAMPFAAHLAAVVDSPAFAPAFATQVSWLAKEGQQHARLTLNPAELGPVAVRIMLEGTQARIDFSAAIASTRAAIEASLPTLAAALHDNGMTLAGGGVSDGQARPGAQGDRAPTAQGPAQGGANGADPDPLTAVPLRAARGLVDLVA